MVTKDMVDEEPHATHGVGAVHPPLQGDSLDSPLEFWGCHIAGGGSASGCSTHCSSLLEAVQWGQRVEGMGVRFGG